MTAITQTTHINFDVYWKARKLSSCTVDMPITYESDPDLLTPDGTMTVKVLPPDNDRMLKALEAAGEAFVEVFNKTIKENQ
ncbi:hypothetical protein [Bifidobacterium platyrrhinorum]|uniref:Uncharacterized protein n=1 Tax=Bifidobacterium platyrrhinorum TaxID=2661628 RepID=A0A6L9SV62_9BIFI|nr:hypothetical protein [Bifidobacterium platyrrhinorum]NEG55432.1 hypothetical protein [Bifidobacterium platyrrhinorum]